MRIGILGSGLMGAALGLAWHRAGRDIVFCFARDRGRLDRLARSMGPSASAGTPLEATSDADIVLFAVPLKSVDLALAQAGPLHDRMVVSCSLPMTDDDTELALGHRTSGAEVLARRTGARVVSAFNTVPSEMIGARGGLDSHEHPDVDVVICGDDAGAKAVVADLARGAGFEPVDVGPLRMARVVEPFGLMVGHLA